MVDPITRSGGPPRRAPTPGPQPLRRRAGACASLAVRGPLSAPSQRAQVVSVHPHAVYLRPASGPLLAVVDASAVRVPGAVVVDAADLAGLRAAVGGGGTVTVGDRRIVWAGGQILVGRWWQPRPWSADVGTAPTVDLRAAAARLHRLLAALPDPFADDPAAGGHLTTLGRALDRGPGPAVEAADRLLGRGPGLTPAGDDAVAGLLAAGRLLRADGGGERRRAAAGAVARRAGERTGAVAAALVAHAARGEVAPEVADLLRALVAPPATAGLPRAVTRLAGVGHTSGAATALGVAVGAALVDPPRTACAVGAAA